MHILTVLILSLALSFCSTLTMKHTAIAIGALDVPRDDRRMHKETVPRGGGVAVFFSLLISSLFALFEYGISLSPLSGAFLSGGALIVGIGLCDDVFSLSPWAKLLSQLLVSFIPIAFGIQVRGIRFGGIAVSFSYIFSVVFSFLWILSLINAFNFIDGLDALAGGTAVICAVALFSCFYSVGNRVWIFLTLALCGACLGFLPYNKYKASMFLGDSGSLLLGYSFALLSASACGIGKAINYVDNISLFKLSAVPSEYSNSYMPFLSVFLIFALPLCDLLFAIIRRLYHRRSIFSADAEHFHHRLLSHGYSHPKSVFILHSFSLLLALSGVLMNYAGF